MNPFFTMNPMMQIIQQVHQVRNDPSQLALVLKQKGIINDEQFAEVSKMGGNYGQIGQYLMRNGVMPNNVQQYQNQVNEIQRLMK